MVWPERVGRTPQLVGLRRTRSSNLNRRVRAKLSLVFGRDILAGEGRLSMTGGAAFLPCARRVTQGACRSQYASAMWSCTCKNRAKLLRCRPSGLPSGGPFPDRFAAATDGQDVVYPLSQQVLRTDVAGQPLEETGFEDAVGVYHLRQG